jgi:hypothetical protein
VIFGVVEGGEVHVFDDLAHAAREWAQYPDDVESDVIVFYDSDGTWLKPVISREPRRLLGLLPGAKRFKLVREAARDSAVDPIWLAFLEASTLAPNEHVGSLAELRARFPKMPPNKSLERTREG